MRTTNDMFWEIVKSDFSWLMKEEGNDEDDSFYDDQSKKSAKVLICNSFYDLFVNPFSKIQLFRYRSNVKFEVGKDWEKDTYGDYEVERFDKPNYLGDVYNKTSSYHWKKDKLIEDDDFVSFYHFIVGNKIPECHLATNRGNAFIIENDKINDNDKISEEYNFNYYTTKYNTQKVYRWLFVQLETRNYGLLQLKNTKEVPFDPKNHFFSFAINNDCIWHYPTEIYFFGLKGLEYSKKNCISIINRYIFENKQPDKHYQLDYDISYNILYFDHIFLNDSSTILNFRIRYFKESEYIYTITIHETTYEGRLKENQLSVIAKINFQNDEILKFKGSKTFVNKK